MPNVYALVTGDFVTYHDSAVALLLYDRAVQRDPKLDAMARSGDYFVTLATSLETLASELSEVSPVVTSLALSKLADELTYLQRHYEIVRKSRPDHLSEL